MPVSDDLEQFRTIPTGTLSDAMGKQGSLHSSIKPLFPSARLAGPAFTVKCPPNDNLTIHHAINLAQAGDVLVVAAGGSTEYGLIGEIMSLACQLKGIAGIVLDGGCRDASEIEALGFPVFASGINPRGTSKQTLDSVNVPIHCGGQLIKPGDIVVGDRDGVVVIPGEGADQVLARAHEIVEREKRVHALLNEGKSTMEIFGLDTLIKQKGVG